MRSKAIEYPFVNPQTGPFYVEDAELGDTLAIHLMDVQPARDWAASGTVSLLGALTSTHYTQTLQDPLHEKSWIYKVDSASKTVLFKALDSDYGTASRSNHFTERSASRQLHSRHATSWYRRRSAATWTRPRRRPAQPVVDKVPKQFLPSDIPWMNGVHQKMRARGRAVMASRKA